MTGNDEEEASTARGRATSTTNVLVVHDPSIELDALWMALAAEFLVQEVTTPYDALERLSGAPLACIVCVASGSIRAEDFYDFVVRISLDASRRLVFVAEPDALSPAFLKRSGCNWLALPVQPEELLVLVRAVSSS